jgi:lysophospholipase L1-like esterase
MRLGGVALGALVTALLIGCSASPGGDDVPDPDAPRVAFYGDSYTLGTGASDPALRWSSRISADRGWIEFNPSVNGLGFVNNRGVGVDLPSVIVAQSPDIVVVTMGLNDNFSYDRVGVGIREQIEADFAFLRAELPAARIVAVEPFWYTDTRPESVAVIIGWVRDAAERIDADWISGASRWIEGHPEWMAPDGLHPNDAGYAEMTRRMDAELARLGL